VYFGGLAFFAAVSAALLVAGYEFFLMARRAGHRPIVWLGLALIALFLLNAFLRANREREILAAAIAASLILAIFWREEDWIASWGLTLAGALYIGALGAHAILIRELTNGFIWTLTALIAVWATDTGAYLVGTRIGRRGFFTAISPKKTWEGAIGGLFSATVATLALGALWAGMHPIHALLFGFGIGVAATFGDLAESLLKRQTGVKDSSDIVPGHGGVLDRIDSLLFAAPFAYYYLTLILRV
jgi:phosphatidate cytidylyltransferase